MIQKISRRNKTGKYKLALKSANGNLMFLCRDPFRKRYYFTHSKLYSEVFNSRLSALAAFSDLVNRLGNMTTELIYPTEKIIIFKKSDVDDDTEVYDK